MGIFPLQLRRRLPDAAQDDRVADDVHEQGPAAGAVWPVRGQGEEAQADGGGEEYPAGHGAGEEQHLLAVALVLHTASVP